jgi:hypothetical protein
MNLPVITQQLGYMFTQKRTFSFWRSGSKSGHYHFGMTCFCGKYLRIGGAVCDLRALYGLTPYCKE